MESLEEYVLVSQDQPLITSYFRQPDGTSGAFTFARDLGDTEAAQPVDRFMPPRPFSPI